MTHNPVEIVGRFHQAFAARDKDRLASLFRPEIEWTSAENFIYADRSPYKGIDAVLGLILGRLFEDWDAFSITAEETLGAGGLVISSGRFRGIFKTTGAPVDAQFVQVFQCEGGQIAKVQVYTDTAQFKEAVSRIRSARV